MKNSFNRCKRLFFSLSVFFFLSSCLVPFISPILLKVDGRTWTVREFQKHADLHLKAGFSERPPISSELLKKRMINELILQALMESWLVKHHLKVSVDAQVVPEKHLLSQRGLSLRDVRQRQRNLRLRETVLKHLGEKELSSFSQGGSGFLYET